MTINRPKLAVVGVGRMGQLHLKKCLELSDKIELIGFFDPSPQQARLVREQYQVTAFEDLSRLFFEADAVVIASNTPTHFSLARDALSAGLHVLIEKPMTETLAQAEELIGLAHRNQVNLQVGFLERYRLRALTQGLDLSSPVFIEANRLATVVGREPEVDVFADLMIHDLDLALSLVQGQLSKVSSVAGRVSTDYFDVAMVQMEFDDGSIVRLNASRVAPLPQRTFKVHAGDKIADLNFATNSSQLSQRAAGELNCQTVSVEAFDALREQLLDFVTGYSIGRRPVVSGEDGLKVLRFVSLLQQEASTRSFASPLSVRDRNPHEALVAPRMALPPSVPRE